MMMMMMMMFHAVFKTDLISHSVLYAISFFNNLIIFFTVCALCKFCLPKNFFSSCLPTRPILLVLAMNSCTQLSQF